MLLSILQFTDSMKLFLILFLLDCSPLRVSSQKYYVPPPALFLLTSSALLALHLPPPHPSYAKDISQQGKDLALPFLAARPSSPQG